MFGMEWHACDYFGVSCDIYRAIGHASSSPATQRAVEEIREQMVRDGLRPKHEED